MELVAVLLGGVLALAGTFIAEWHNARTRAAEARRARVEAFRQELSAAVVSADYALTMIEDKALGFTVRLPDQIDEVLNLVDETVANARKTLLAAIVALPSGASTEVREAVDQLRRALEEARAAGVAFAVAYSLHENTPGDAGYYEAHGKLDDASAALGQIIELARSDL